MKPRDPSANEQADLTMTAATDVVPRNLINRALLRPLLFSQVMALVWWLVALWIRERESLVWHDQVNIFRASVQAIADPYTVSGFVHAPWVTLLIAPFSWLPLEISTLLQSGLLFGLITLVVFKFGGDWKVVVIALTSFVALDAVLEMNVDWCVIIGLVVPVEYSAPFLLIKPQLALGYYFSTPREKWLRTGIIAVITLVVSLVIWGNYIARIISLVPTLSIGRSFNIAPLHLLPWPISLAIGLVLAYLAFRRRDPPLGIIAWFFFTPYVSFYSLVLLLAMVAIRFRLLAIIITASLWVIYGGVVFSGLLQR